MSKYTTEVRYICESLAGETVSQGYDKIDEIIEAAAPLVFSFGFPIFDENYRLALEKTILRHYYTREIGEETYGLWKLRLESRMREKMPYFNQLYSSALLSFNPLYDVDVTRTHEGTGSEQNDRQTNRTRQEGETTADSAEQRQTEQRDARRLEGESSVTASQSNGTSATSDERAVTGTKWDKFSNTPQGQLTGVEDGTYLTEARQNTDSTSDAGSSNAESNNVFNSNDTKNRDETSSETVEHGNTSQSNGTRNKDEKENGSESAQVSSMDEYTETVTGKQGGASFSSLLKEFRETFINVDEMVIDSLSDLFINLW